MKLPKTFGDWYLIFIYCFIAAMLLLSCSKSGYKPDHDQVICKNVSYWKQLFTDSVSNNSLNDSTMVNSRNRCVNDGDKTSIDAIELVKAENYGIKWERLCDIDGTPYYIKTWSVIKTN